MTPTLSPSLGLLVDFLVTQKMDQPSGIFYAKHDVRNVFNSWNFLHSFFLANLSS